MAERKKIKMSIDKSKVAVIGLGPGGVSAAIYLKRYGRTPVCFEKENVGGKVNLTDRIENYPGYRKGSGPELAMVREDQLSDFSIPVRYEEVLSLTRNGDGSYRLKTVKGEEDFVYVILAIGLKPRPFPLKGEEKFSRRGISSCAICDGPFYKGKDVIVIGGGNSAFQEAIYLSSLCSHVSLVSHHEKLKAEPVLVDRFKSLENTSFYVPYEPLSVSGETSFSSLTRKNSNTGEEVTLKADGLFLFVGDRPQTSFVHLEGVMDEKGYLLTDDLRQTKEKNLFAVGDCRSTPLRQVTRAVSDGSLAATRIHRDFEKEENR